MARQTDDAYVVGEGLAAKLGAEAYLVSLLQELGLKVEVAEGASCLVAARGQIVVIVDGTELHR